VVTTFLAAAALLGSSPGAACPATVVRYQSAKQPAFGKTPWVLAQPQAAGITAFLVSYPESLRDARVNRSDTLVLWRVGARVVWNSSGTLVARRLDRRSWFHINVNQTADGAVSAPRFPSVGCWRLTFRSDAGAASIVARVISPPTTLGCAATILESGSAFARPRSSGIRGGWPWQTAGPASLATHGHAGGLNMKVLWQVRRNWGTSLELLGTRLDAEGSFRQEFPMAYSPESYFPSTVDVPAAGCWSFTLRTGSLAGVLVVRAVDAPG
jgi:hypothetical protein